MQISVHNTPTNLLGRELSIGKEAPAIRVTKLDGTQNVIGMIASQIQLLISLPSIKTDGCSLGAKKFDEAIKSFPKLITTIVTTDKKDEIEDFVKSQNIENLEIVIDSDKKFGKKYGVLIEDGKLKDRLARAVFVVDKEGIVIYKEIVSEVTNEIDYDACLSAIETKIKEKKKGHTHENWMSV